MCGCLKTRTNVLQMPGSATGRPSTGASQPMGRIAHATVQFEYVGRTTLTAIGSVTGRRYRFDAPGTRVAVDVRDQASFAPIPSLRLIRN